MSTSTPLPPTTGLTPGVTPGVTRRTVLRAGAAGTALAATALASGPDASAATGDPTRTDRIGTGTDFAVRVSPDGRTLALDVLGVLWVCSSSGGDARRLTSDLFDIAQPDWSPDGSTLVVQSYRDAVFNLWTVRPDGSQLRQLTQGPYDHREPRWSPDGRTIAFSSDLRGSYGIYAYDVASATIRVLADDPVAEEYEPTWSPDGTKVAFVVDNTRIDVVTVATGVRSTLGSVPTGVVLHMPQWLPDGSGVIAHRLEAQRNELVTLSAGTSAGGVVGAVTAVVTGEEVLPFRASFPTAPAAGADRLYYYTSEGKVRRRRLGDPQRHTVGFTAAVQLVTPSYRKRRRQFDSRAPQQVKGIGSPTLSPDGRSVAFRALGDLYVGALGQRPRPLFRDGWWVSDPDWSPDGRRLAYASDRTGTLNLWVRDVATASDTQLTFFTESAAVSCRWSPDGSELAYLDQDGGLWVLDVASGDVQLVFPATFEPGRPTWSPDGSIIALAAVKPYSKRYREGLSKILLVNRRTGEATYVDPAPDRSLQTRGDDGPVWSPDGRWLCFAMESVLWLLPVGRDGRPTGPARRLTDVVSDAPSWSGDGRTVLFLSNGTLRTVRVDTVAGGGSPSAGTAHDLPLTWTNDPGTDALVVHAGRMWDGVSRTVVRDVDILVSGQRITGIEPHRAGRPGRLVDASDRFVMPGLIDIHHHREMQGYSYGSRQGPLWLSLGITTTRSPGSPAYHMVEEREAVQSGHRVAPRYFGTGEAVDGPRIYYNFMRPTFTAAQLPLELSRAGALDYDLMKCYVRLPTVWQKQVIAWAHDHGVPSTSHYHYPAMAFGGDQTEHIGATNRFGYSRTVTNVGSGFEDVISMFNESRMARTPTLFVSSTLYRDDTSLVTDPRVTRMYPLWRQKALAATVTTARTTDQTATRANLRHQVAQVLAMVRGGGLVTTGTDSPIDHLAISTHMNLRACVKYGLTPYEALVTATSSTGAYLGEQLGQVRAGFYADLAIVDGDPLARIEDAAAVTAVVTGGRYRTVEELLAPYDGPTATHGDATPATAGPGTAGPGTAGPGTQTAARPAARARANRIRPAVPRHPSTAGFWWNDPQVLAHAREACCEQH